MKPRVLRHRYRRRNAPPVPPPPTRGVAATVTERGKAVASKVLDGLVEALEKDPEAVARGAEQAFEGLMRISKAAGDLRRWIADNPEAAKQKLKETVVETVKGAAAAGRARRDEK